MKTKKIVYFDHPPNNTSQNHSNSPTKKTISISKTIRDTSANKYHKNMQNLNISRLSNADKNGPQKIKILLMQDGFIVEKRIMPFDIQCTFIKNSFCQSNHYSHSEQPLIPPLCLTQTPTSSFTFSSSQEKSDSNNFLLNIETNTIGLTQNCVRHNFAVPQETASYLQIKINGYNLEHVCIQNKKIEFVRLTDTNYVIDEQDVTIMWPLKLKEDEQLIRERKLQQYFERISDDQECNKQKYNLFWTSQTDTIEYPKNHSKRSEPEWSELFKCNPSSPMPLQALKSERSYRKLNTSYGDKIFKENNNKSSRDSVKKNQLIDLMKSRELVNKTKIEKATNDSEVYGNCKNGKEKGKNEDAYGLKDLQEPKFKSKGSQVLGEKIILRQQEK